MRWEPDVARGAWLGERVVEQAGDMHIAVPRGFEAYARVFHPIEADLPVGATWADVARAGRVWSSGFERRAASWTEVAEASGATVHPLMQWGAITQGGLETASAVGLVGAAGWRYGEPIPGTPGAEVVALLARVLAEHTSTPAAGVAAVWEGWGGLFAGDPGRAVLSFTSTDEAIGTRLRTAVTPPGPLGSDIRLGPRLSLPWRDHVLFDAGVDEFAAPDWPARAPWVGSTAWPECPSLIWPDDHAWVVVSEIDWDSTIVAGGRAAIDAVLAASGIEALEIPEGADLSSRGDTING